MHLTFTLVHLISYSSHPLWLTHFFARGVSHESPPQTLAHTSKDDSLSPFLLIFSLTQRTPFPRRGFVVYFYSVIITLLIFAHTAAAFFVRCSSQQAVGFRPRLGAYSAFAQIATSEQPIGARNDRWQATTMAREWMCGVSRARV